MKNSARMASCLALLMLAHQAGAECSFPKAPESLPDGKTATAEEMSTAIAAFKAYNEEVNAFGACLEEENKSKSGTAQLMQIKTMQAKKINAAVAELQNNAKLFNEQVRIFKAR